MELFGTLRLENILYFVKRKPFLKPFLNPALFIPSSKKRKKPPRKRVLIFQEMELLVINIKNFQ